MNYQKIWEKTLSEDEKIKHEFSVGDKYRKFGMILWVIFSLLLLFIWVGVVILPISIFYFGFYLKVANAYAFTNKRILVHKGWLSTHTTSIDYDKITDVQIKEPLFDRVITQSGHLIINTAGTTSHEIILEHIETPYEVKKKLDQIRK